MLAGHPTQYLGSSDQVAQDWGTIPKTASTSSNCTAEVSGEVPG